MSIKRQRVEGRIHHILSVLFQREIADPRLTGLSVTSVRLDPELRHAFVKINALGEEERQEEIMAALARATGYLRREIGRLIRLKHTPQLHFHWDATLQHGVRIHALLEEIAAETTEVDANSTTETTVDVP
jgi:ribosome-binding factor A